MFSQKAGPVWETLRDLEKRLEEAGIPYVVIGGMALNAHQFQRQTVDVDICLRKDDLARFRRMLVGTAYQSVEGRKRRFRDQRTEVTFDLLISGQLAGRTDRNKEVLFPDPSEAVEVAGLRTVSLDRLIALKLVTWRLRDWADVVALIRVNRLDADFAQKLPESTRSTYLQCYDQMLEEDRYDRELDQD